MLKNAGVLFYTVVSGKRHFLLGQETHIEGYKNSGVWSGFEGGPEDGETEIECAVRECQEESLCAVMPTAMLRGKLHRAAKLTLRVRETGHESFHFVLYAVQVPRREGVRETFLARRTELLLLRSCIQEYDDAVSAVREQDLPSIGCLWRGIVFLDIYHVRPDSHGRRAWLHCSVLRSGVARHEITAVGCSASQAAALEGMAHTWTRVKNAVHRVDQACVEPLLHGRFVQSYRCRECFLEKSDVRWVSEGELMNSLSPSSRGTLPLRYSFSVLMASMLERHPELMR